MCIQVDMHWQAFRQLSMQNRFGGAGSEQLQGAMGHIMTSCTEPFPDPFTYYPANLKVGDFSIDEIGIRKKGFVGSVLSESEERPSFKIKSDKYSEVNSLTTSSKSPSITTSQIRLESNLPHLPTLP